MAYYPEQGTRYSPQIDLSGISEIADSKVYFEYTLNGGTITIETRLYNGGSWTAWTEINTSGDSIPNLNETSTILECRQTLATTDSTQSPVLEKLYIYINQVFFNNLLKEDGTDFVITELDGLTPVPWENVSCDPIELTGEAHFKAPALTNDDTDYNYYYLYWSNSSPLSSESNIWGNNALLIQHLNESSGNMLDSSSDGNDGTVNGTVTRNSNGKVGDCIDLRGGYIEVPANDTDILAPDYLTVSAWISVDSISDYDTIIGKGWIGEGYSLRLRTDGRVVFSIHDTNPLSGWTEVESDPGAILTNVYSGDDLVTERWYKIRGTYDGTDLELMINGEVVGTTDASEVTRAKKDQNLGIGCEPGDGYGRTLDGRIDEVRIFDHYKSPEWELTEFNNQVNTNNFYTIQNLESIS